jgi:hypothetical protein
MKFTTFAIFIFALTGCTVHHTPYIMYDGDVPFSETSVFVAHHKIPGKSYNARIISVDGKETGCFYGCPEWVRVLPGKHVFYIHYTSNYMLVGNKQTYDFINLQIEVPNMEKYHVYVSKYTEVDRHVKYSVDDVGSNWGYHEGEKFTPVFP